MAWTKFYCFVEDMAEKKHDLGSDTLKIALTNIAPDPTNTVLADITEITAANGYSAGGASVTTSSAAQSDGLYKVLADDITFTADGGDVGPFRYIVLYNSSAADGPLIAFNDYGVNFTIPDAGTFTIAPDASGGLIAVQ